jgi:hypothetical protein
VDGQPGRVRLRGEEAGHLQMALKVNPTCNVIDF